MLLVPALFLAVALGVNAAEVTLPTGTGLPEPSGRDPVNTVATTFMNWLLSILGVLAVIAFVISGIQYITSAGNQDSIETAKKNMKWSIVGVAVALISLTILNTIYNITTGSF